MRILIYTFTLMILMIVIDYYDYCSCNVIAMIIVALVIIIMIIIMLINMIIIMLINMIIIMLIIPLYMCNYLNIAHAHPFCSHRARLW